MAKEEPITVEAVVTEALPNARFRAKLESGHEILAHVSGKMRMHYIRILPGDKITVDNGLINLEVLEKHDREMRCRVLDGGVLKSKRHINLPGVRVNLPAITQKDRRDILFGLEHDVDFIDLSFVREANDIRQLKKLLDKKVDAIQIRQLP